MSNVIQFTGLTRNDMEPDSILENSIGELSEVVLVGFDKEGDFVFASSKADAGETIFLLERGKHKLMQCCDDLEDE
ncbi:hypothetical protein [Maritalea porphyrae]|uniref:hypothetical protein n=1 Tax=Maritalea porphyrae TaxID=880732 RepID=UPI0022B038B2|nr:hypothetical protein [Maritalea porphyrae]MCZ4270904.1 hypothetical protein [Maritalea porphyrae]